MSIVEARCGIEQMDRRDIALAAARGRNPTQTTDRKRASGKTLLRNGTEHDVEGEAMTAREYQIRYVPFADQCYLGVRAGINFSGQRFDFDETISLRKCRDRA